MNRRLWIAALLLAAAAPTYAQTSAVTPTPPDFPRGVISGYLFGDWYDNLAGNLHHGYDAAGVDSGQANIDGKNVITRDLNGVQLRRAYFQVDNDLSIKYSTRFRLEADSKSLTSDGKIGVAVKAAYMKVRNVYPRADLYFGVIATPTFENSEEYWQYRSIEKTMVDFRGLAPSADVGVELKGFADPGHVVGYSADDGQRRRPEARDQPRQAHLLRAARSAGRTCASSPTSTTRTSTTAKDKATYKLFAGYDIPHGAVGSRRGDQVAHKPVGAYYVRGRRSSVFARYPATPTLAGFARVDLWQPDRRVANRVDQHLYIVGVDWQPLKDVHFMPNIESMQYRRRARASFRRTTTCRPA